jgi:hypothetical protein
VHSERFEFHRLLSLCTEFGVAWESLCGQEKESQCQYDFARGNE